MKELASIRPNLFVIGAPKCGTTSMVHYLSQHPNIFVSQVKEPHYFNTDSGHRYYFDEEKYLKLFSEAKPEHTCICEGSVWYLYSNDAIGEILRFNPDAKFLVMLRNPVSMFFSLHQELLFGGSENIESAEEAWGAQESRKQGKHIPSGCSDPRLLQYGEACKLGVQLKKAIETIPKEALKYVFLNDLANDPDATYQSVLNFLELPAHRLEDYPAMNPKKKRKSQNLSRFFIFTTRLKKRLGLRRGLGMATAINKLNVVEAEDIDPEVFNQLSPVLKDYFREDIQLLESLVHRDLSEWYT